MNASQISPFEYITILVSIILGLGITQILSSFADLLYHRRKVKFYWPHSIWIAFVLFLQIQDWFITYELRTKAFWKLPELLFVLLYPITLFTAAKMLLPTNDEEERVDMKVFYQSQFPIIFRLIGISILLSISFNLIFLKIEFLKQIPLLIFFGVTILLSYIKVHNEGVHKALAVIILTGVILSVLLEQNVWVIK